LGDAHPYRFLYSVDFDSHRSLSFPTQKLSMIAPSFIVMFRTIAIETKNLETLWVIITD
jgi:hypothetical protein